MSEMTITGPEGGFQFLKGIRVKTDIHGTWFAVRDIAGKMGTQTGAITQKTATEDLKKKYCQTSHGYHDLVFIKESALYEMIIRSNSKSDWIATARKEIIGILVENDVLGFKAAFDAKREGRKENLARHG
ncbi:hypothetical protein [Nocardia phage NC1]|nr:hypothetical protein [Nocardia phage NC1]QSL67781.1 hypothetical protein [Nocardia phage P69]